MIGVAKFLLLCFAAKSILYILYLKHMFQRSSRVIFLQITSHSYFKLIRCMPINDQMVARHGPDARGPQLWPRHVTIGNWLKNVGDKPSNLM
jgi:hypothetical protein